MTYHDGTYHGQQAIEKEYERMYFKLWNKSNYFTTIRRVFPVGNEVRLSGTWSDTYEEAPAGTVHADGTFHGS